MVTVSVCAEEGLVRGEGGAGGADATARGGEEGTRAGARHWLIATTPM